MKKAIEILQERVAEAAFYLDSDEVNVIVAAMEEYARQQVNSGDLADVGGALPDDSGDVATESALNMGKTLDMGKK